MAGMVVKNNLSAVDTLNTLNKNHSALSKSLRKVSSGMRINSAADDASGYAISERMRVQIRSLDQANRNAQNGNSMMKVAEGAVQSTVDILKTLKEKVLNAANDTNTDSDRQQIQKELDQSIDQINDNANVTYNGKYLIDGSHNRRVVTAPMAAKGPDPGRINDGIYTYSGTVSSFTNRSLGSNVTNTTKVTEITDSTGRNLEINEGDTVTVSWVRDGKTNIVSYQVRSSLTLGNIFTGDNDRSDATAIAGVAKPSDITKHLKLVHLNERNCIGVDESGNKVYTPDLGSALTFGAYHPGVDGQISGFTICVTDKDGNINKSANAVLDAWEETIRGQNASKDNSIVLQTGTRANQAVKVGFTDMRARALGLQGRNGNTLNVCTQANANIAINVLDTAIQKALNEITKIGAVESRLEYTSANLATAAENVTASESTIRDADMAKEMTEYTKNNVLLQAAQSMLAQANQNSSSVLSLLQ